MYLKTINTSGGAQIHMEVLVDRAANDSLKGEDWASILEICDIVNNCSVETGYF